MPGYSTVLGVLMMAERQGLFCRYGCKVKGKDWVVQPKTESSWDDMRDAITLRDEHEVKEHGAVYLVWTPEQSGFNTTFTRKTR